MSTTQTQGASQALLKWCELSDGQRRVQATPDLLGTYIGPRKGLGKAFEDYQQDWILKLTQPGTTSYSSNPLVQQVESLPEIYSKCQSGCPKTAHITFYPEVTEDSEGKRAYTVEACCNPTLSDSRHAGFTSFIPDLVQFRDKIDGCIIKRHRDILEKTAPKLSLSEDRAGFAMLVNQILSEHSSDQRERGETASCHGFEENDPSLTEAAESAWLATRRIIAESSISSDSASDASETKYQESIV